MLKIYKKISRHSLICICLLVAACGLTSCSKYDSYKEFIKKGEVNYPGKPDTVIAFAGINRVQLALLVPDPKIIKIQVYWNNRVNKIEVPVVKPRNLTDTIKILLPDLEEASYGFEIITVDEESNLSVKTEAQGTAYGSNYINSLLNRGLKSSATGIDGITRIEWYGGEEKEDGLELNYTSRSGETKLIKVAKDKNLLEIPDFQPGKGFKYRTFFRPDSNLIDVFVTAFIELPAPVATYPELDKAKFKEYPLPGDAPSAYGWLLRFMWDNNLNDGAGFHTPLNSPSPHHFTFDLGVTTQLSEFRVYQRRDVYYYGYGNPKEFEIWGSTNPSPDGSFTNWVKLMDCKSVKPSGPGPVTQADKDYANAGDLFKFPGLTQPVRYIRFKIIKNWSDNISASSGTSVHIMELSFKGSF